MVINLKHINEKSFNNFSISNSSYVKDINVIFGNNGSGKTALSNFLQSQQQKEVRVFDTDYVDTNIKSRDTVEGTNLIIGAEQLDLTSTSTRVEEIISNLDKNSNELKQSISHEKQTLNSQMKSVIDSVKADFKTTKKINQKPNAFTDPIKAIELWKAESVESDKNESKYNSSDAIDKELTSTRAQIKLMVPILLEFDIDRRTALITSLKNVILVPESSTTETVISWLKRGLELHNLDEESALFPEELECIFCGNDFTPVETVNTINKRINSEHARLIVSIQRLREKLKNAQQIVENLGTIIPQDVIKDALNGIQTISKLLIKKEENSDKSFELSMDVFISIDKYNKQINEKLKFLKTKETKLIQDQLTIENLAKQRIGQIISQDGKIAEHTELLRNLERQLKDQIYAQKLNNIFLQELKNKTNHLQGFMEMVNQTLYSLGMGFKLVYSRIDKHSFDVQLIESKQEEIEVHSLSEGEIRLIAFIKFYYGLFSKYRNTEEKNNKRREFDSSIGLIILDDPITSIDSNNRYFMITLINRLLSESVHTGIDIVILTHSTYDFHSFGYTMRKQIGHFRIIKNEQAESEIEWIDSDHMKNYSDEYRSTFSEVFKFCCMNSRELLNINQYIRYGNQCRFLLETHARSNYMIENVTFSFIDKIMDTYGIENTYKTRIAFMLNTINSLSHGIPYTWDFVSNISAREIQQSARILIFTLYQKDAKHVQAMIENNDWRNCKHQITNWNLD